MTNKLSIRLEFALTPSAPPPSHLPVPRLLTSPVQTPMANTTIHFTASYLRPFCSHRKRMTQFVTGLCSQRGRNTSWSTSFRVNFTWTAKTAKMMSDREGALRCKNNEL